MSIGYLTQDIIDADRFLVERRFYKRRSRIAVNLNEPMV